MHLRMMHLAVLLVLLTALGWSQSDSAKPITYTLEPIKISNAIYPSQAREQKTQGRVIAVMLVSETGDVENVDVFKADAILSQAAKDTIREWKFKPVAKDGTAVPVIAKVTFNFVLGNEEQQSIVPQVDPATDFPQHVRVSETVMRGLVLSKVSPEYPPAAKANHVQGVVILAITIRKDGTSDVQILSGPAELTAAAVDAARQWQYRPYQFMGRPVEVQTTSQFIFR